MVGQERRAGSGCPTPFHRIKEHETLRRKYPKEACAYCGLPFESFHKKTRYCSNLCSIRDNPKPQNYPKYPITLELLKKMDEETPDLESPSQVIGRFLGCTPSTVLYAAIRLGFEWRPRLKRKKSLLLATHVERRYVRKTGCVVCGENRVVDAAHLIEKRSGGYGTESNIIPLCPTHHRLYDRGLLSDEENNRFVNFLYIKYPNLEEELREEKICNDQETSGFCRSSKEN